MFKFLESIHINRTVITDVTKWEYQFPFDLRMTMTIFNSVLSSMMDEESSHSTPKQLLDLLHHKQFINSVLALSYSFFFFSLISSYDTSIYLLINNNFDILSYLTLFSVSPFDLQRVIDRFTDKLNQQSSQLVIGDVRNHFNRVGFRPGRHARSSTRSSTGRFGSETARSGSIWGKRAACVWRTAMRNRS